MDVHLETDVSSEIIKTMSTKYLPKRCLRNVLSSKLKVIQHDMDLIRLFAPRLGVFTPHCFWAGEWRRCRQRGHPAVLWWGPQPTQTHTSTTAVWKFSAFGRDTLHLEGERSQTEHLQLFLTACANIERFLCPIYYQLAWLWAFRSSKLHQQSKATALSLLMTETLSISFWLMGRGLQKKVSNARFEMPVSPEIPGLIGVERDNQFETAGIWW